MTQQTVVKVDLKLAFKDLKIFKVTAGINENLFSYSENKKLQIAFMPRKLNEDIKFCKSDML